MRALQQLVLSGDLPATTSPDPAAALQAAVDFGVAIEPLDALSVPPDGVSIAALQDAVAVDDDGVAGCIDVVPTGPSPTIVLAGDDSGSFALQPTGGDASVAVADANGSQSAARPIQGDSGSPVLVRVHTETGRPVVGLPAGGGATICGAALR